MFFSVSQGVQKIKPKKFVPTKLMDGWPYCEPKKTLKTARKNPT